MFYVILSTLINFISIENYIAAKSTVCYMRDWLQFSVADVLTSIRAQPVAMTRFWVALVVRRKMTHKMSDNKLLCISNNYKLILNLLEEELEKNLLLFSYLMSKKKIN